MPTRRSFLKTAFAAAAAAPLTGGCGAPAEERVMDDPIVVSTWNFGGRANAAAWDRLREGDAALDAVVAGVAVTEADPTNGTVGLGGLPDRDGRVSLDACVMDERGDAGAVAALSDIVHAAAVARAVMRETPHVMLAGEGARRFALEQGFPEQDLLTPESERAWREWLKSGEYRPIINVEQHDTIGMLARDARGDLSGACTTSGVSFKMAGRVGDSPIIGAALFVDNEVGGAVATGLGEAVMKTCGAFLVVELMRQGMSPEGACRAAAQRIADRDPDAREMQVAYLALTPGGDVGSWALQPGFTYALRDAAGHRDLQAGSLFDGA